jgi:hypothetical protein
VAGRSSGTAADSARSPIERRKNEQPTVRKRDYHPDQHGSWSIKAVLPTVCPDLGYDSLDGVHDGPAAEQTFLEVTAP